jgi:hypothetical protein
VLKDAVYLLVEGELQNDEEHGLAVVAHRISDLLHAIGRDEAGGRTHPRDRGRGTTGSGAASAPATAGPAAAGAFVPGGLHAPGAPVPGGPAYKRPDAWELPAVEPRTRPGRTG